MKLLMTVEDEKTLDTFRLVLNEINQDIKTTTDTTYSIKKGKFINFKAGIMKCVSSFNNNERTLKKCPKLDEIMSNLNGSVDGINLFKWITDYKKYINGLDLYDKHFVIKTSIPEVEFKSGMLDSDDVSTYLKMKKSLGERVAKEEISIETYNEMKQSRLSHTFDFNDIKIIMTFKLFLGMKAKSKCNLSMYEINPKENLFCAVVTIDEGNHMNKLFYPFINY